MRFTIGAGKHIWMFETAFSHAKIQKTSEQADGADEHVGIDPHGTVSCHSEISPHAIGAYAQRRMGFHGSEAAGTSEIG